MKFKKTCPSCLAKDKLVSHCRKCFKSVCCECSVNLLCIDCFTNISDVREVEAYFIDKYEVLV